jgi:TolA-binding protein
MSTTSKFAIACVVLFTLSGCGKKPDRSSESLLPTITAIREQQQQLQQENVRLEQQIAEMKEGMSRWREQHRQLQQDNVLLTKQVDGLKIHMDEQLDDISAAIDIVAFHLQKISNNVSRPNNNGIPAVEVRSNVPAYTPTPNQPAVPPAFQPPSAPAQQTCVQCRGIGHSGMACSSCGGTGFSGSFACSSCNGTKFSPCFNCNGTGKTLGL